MYGCHENYPNCNSRAHTGPPTTTNEEVEAVLILRVSVDNTVPQYGFIKIFKITTPNRVNWIMSPVVKTGKIWYADGSKTQYGVRVGIYRIWTRMKISISLGQNATVFQAEVAATERYVVELLRQKVTNKIIAFFSDNQAVIKALGFNQVSSRLVEIQRSWS